MKIYLIERTDKIDYDEYDSVVVCAKNKKEALSLSTDKLYSSISTLTYTKIGKAKKNQKKGIILASFNAG